MSDAPLPTERLDDPERVAALLHPLRQRIVREAREPASATEIARRLDLPRQRVNHHVRALADAGILIPAETRRRRGAIERRYRASAESYRIAPGVLGALGAALPSNAIRPGPSLDDEAELPAGPAQLARAATRCRAALARLTGEGAGPTLTVEAGLRFPTAEARSAFARDLEVAIQELLARHAAPLEGGDGRAFQMLIGIWPDERPES